MKKKTLVIPGICLAGLILINPMNVSAEGLGNLGGLVPNAGIASIYSLELTEEDCLKAASEVDTVSWGYTNLGIADVSGNLNVRKEPSTSAALSGKMKGDSACEIIEVVNGWAKVKSGEVEGYVSLDYLLTGAAAKIKARELVNVVAKVNVDALKVRDDASLEGAVLTQVPKNEELDYVGTVGEWIKVNIDGNEAFVFGEYVDIIQKLDTAITMQELQYGEGVTNLRVDLVEYAKQFIGNPYVWGGTSLTKGADCSGFVQLVFKKFDIKLSRTSRTQAGDGKKIGAADLQPGDLIFYANSSGTINHVAIYIGNSQVVHASSPKTGIKISNYNYRTPVKYVDVIKD